jgi:hypothetical protein
MTDSTAKTVTDHVIDIAQQGDALDRRQLCSLCPLDSLPTRLYRFLPSIEHGEAMYLKTRKITLSLRAKRKM